MRIGFLFLFAYCFISPDDAYRQQLDRWHAQRIASLRSETGWLNLAGLHWLKEGRNSIGRGEKFNVALPSLSRPGSEKNATSLGVLIRDKDVVRYVPAPGASVTLNGQPVTAETVVFAPDDKAPVLAAGSLRWFIIKRGNKVGVRIRDLNSPQLAAFHGIDRFAVDETWRIPARLEKPAEPRTIGITDVIGLTSQQPLAGTVVFERGGKTYRLDATGEGTKLFLVFADQTNGTESYGAGRFLYADVAADGSVTLDFNQAINPPCAFTPYATCPLPPKQNRLALRVTAGEKNAGEH